VRAERLRSEAHVTRLILIKRVNGKTQEHACYKVRESGKNNVVRKGQETVKEDDGKYLKVRKCSKIAEKG